MLKEYELTQIRLEDLFWNNYAHIIRTGTIPYQYKVLDNDPSVAIENENRIDSFPNRKSNALENLRIAAGRSTGERYGMIFQDSDVYKWLEAVAYSLAITPDPDLQKLADGVVELIAAAQGEDGYIDSYFQLKAPKLRYRVMYYGHELYCMGHLLEALVAYREATGNDTALAIADRIVAHLDRTFGYEESKIPCADGHQEIEIGLLRYYELTGSIQARDLAAFFLDVRGKDPDYYANLVRRNVEEGLMPTYDKDAEDLVYFQAHKQPKDQRTVEGHAVRMLYMAAAMARLVRHNADPEMLEACRSIWENVSTKRMYITAGVGSTVRGEAFTGDHDLPNDTMYCETCASIALVYFAYEMFKMDPKTEYMDVIERALYNGILSGASADGTHFFYVNPMEVHANLAAHNPDQSHVKHIRPAWYSCACCPPNFARCIGSVQRYIYTEDTDGGVVYVNLWTDSVLDLPERGVTIRQSEFDLAKGRVVITVDSEADEDLPLRVRIPYWCRSCRITAMGGLLRGTWEAESGEYREILCPYGHVELTVEFEVPVMAVTADPRVAADANRLAVQRGPFVYCAEQIDNEARLTEITVSAADIRSSAVEEGVEMMPDCPKLRVRGRTRSRVEGALYRYDEDEAEQETELTLIPYYRWANRGSGDMMVWLHRRG